MRAQMQNEVDYRPDYDRRSTGRWMIPDHESGTQQM